jgi:hypothetical protein
VEIEERGTHILQGMSADLLTRDSIGLSVIHGNQTKIHLLKISVMLFLLDSYKRVWKV